MIGSLPRGRMERTTPERTRTMGDKKGKKDKAKDQRQKKAKVTKAAKQKQDKQQPPTP